MTNVVPSSNIIDINKTAPIIEAKYQAPIVVDPEFEQKIRDMVIIKKEDTWEPVRNLAVEFKEKYILPNFWFLLCLFFICLFLLYRYLNRTTKNKEEIQEEYNNKSNEKKIVLTEKELHDIIAYYSGH